MEEATPKQTVFIRSMLEKLQSSKEKTYIETYMTETVGLSKQEASTIISYLLYLRSSEISKTKITDIGVMKQ